MKQFSDSIDLVDEGSFVPSGRSEDAPPWPVKRYTGAPFVGWCPGHEPMWWEKKTARKARDLGYWQSAGGWIYPPDGGSALVDWGDLADHFATLD